MDRGYGRGWKGCLTIQIACIIFRDCCLQYTTFLGFSNKESVIKSTMISVHTSAKHEEIKAAPVVTRLPPSLGPRCSVILETFCKYIDIIIQNCFSKYLINNPCFRNFGESFFPPLSVFIILSCQEHENIKNVCSRRTTIANYSIFISCHVHCCCHLSTMSHVS